MEPTTKISMEEDKKMKDSVQKGAASGFAVPGKPGPTCAKAGGRVAMDMAGRGLIRAHTNSPKLSPYASPALGRKRVAKKDGGTVASSRTASGSLKPAVLRTSVEAGCGDLDAKTIIVDEDQEIIDPSTPEKRGRGRPQTTGDFCAKHEIDRLALERDEAEKRKS